MFISKWLLYPDPPRNLVCTAPKTTVIPLLPGTFQYRDWKFMYLPSLFFFEERSLYSTSGSWHVCKIQLGTLLEKLLFTEIKLYMRPKQCPSLPLLSTLRMVGDTYSWSEKANKLRDVSTDISSLTLLGLQQSTLNPFHPWGQCKSSLQWLAAESIPKWHDDFNNWHPFITGHFK